MNDEGAERICPQMARIIADESKKVGPPIAQIFTDLRGKTGFEI
jgi:hypothetical protein